MSHPDNPIENMPEDNPGALSGATSAPKFVAPNCLTDNARQQLAAQQGQLINALLGLGLAPSEVDEKQVEVCRESLKRKRARTIAKFGGERCTTCSIEPELARYFEKKPGVHPDGPRADFRQYQKFVIRCKFQGLVERILPCLAKRSW